MSVSAPAGMRCAYAQLHEYTRLRPQPLAASGHRNNMQATVWRATCARAIQIALHALALAQFAADAQYHNMRVTVLRNSPQARSLKAACHRAIRLQRLSRRTARMLFTCPPPVPPARADQPRTRRAALDCISSRPDGASGICACRRARSAVHAPRPPSARAPQAP